MIDPHIWEDPSFNKLSLQARLLFIGMISHADDDGYLRGDIGSLKRLILGFDEVSKEEIGNWLHEITISIKNIHFFEHNKEFYCHFLKWNYYQKQREDRMQASSYPLCTKCIANVRQVPDKCQTSAGQLPAEVKLSKVKLSKVSIHVDKQRVTPKIYKRLPEDKQQPIHRIGYFYEDLLHTNIVNWGKQAKAVDNMLRAGYTEKQICFTIRKMTEEEYYEDKSFDLMTVANQIGKYKAIMERRIHDRQKDPNEAT